jgi:hypothetical protein
MRDVECTLSWPIVTTHVVCDMLFGDCEISLWDFMPFGPCPKHGCFKIVGGVMVGDEEAMQRHARESEFGRKRAGGGGDGEYVEKGRE